MSRHELKFLVSLANFSKFGSSRISKLRKYFRSFEAAFNGTIGELLKAGIEQGVAEEFASFRAGISPDELIDKLEKNNIQLVTIEDEYYPENLKHIYNPPYFLFYKGDLNACNNHLLAVVGTRKFSPYGKMVVEHLVRDLVKNNFAIVSGLALGIDTLAHFCAIQNSGKTIAVLGSGLDKQSIYPSSNYNLSEKIISDGGLLVSEFAPGILPMRHHFPQRNRIISGLSLGTLVIEAGEKSGALITANLALEQNREVFAVPGNIYSEVSIGPNKIIKQGAKAITCVQDILDALEMAQASSYIDSREIVGENEEEKVILKFLSREPIHVDQLARQSKLDTSLINSTLIIMEMKGMVKNLGGMMYVLAR
jgi:DNA processing protein